MSLKTYRDGQVAMLLRLFGRLFDDGQWPDYEVFYRQNINDRQDIEHLLNQRFVEKDGKGLLSLTLQGFRELRGDPRVGQVLDVADSVLLDLRAAYRTFDGKGQPQRAIEDILEGAQVDPSIADVALFFLYRAGCISGFSPDEKGRFARVSVPSDILDKGSLRLALMDPLGGRRRGGQTEWPGEFRAYFDLYLASEDCRKDLEGSVGGCEESAADRERVFADRTQLLLELTRDLVRGTVLVENIDAAIGQLGQAKRHRRAMSVEETLDFLATLRGSLLEGMCGLLDVQTDEDKRMALMLAVCRANGAYAGGGIHQHRLGFCRAFDGAFVRRWLQWAEELGYVEYERPPGRTGKALVMPTTKGIDAVEAFAAGVSSEGWSLLEAESVQSVVPEPDTDVWSRIKRDYHTTRHQVGRRLAFVGTRAIKAVILRDAKGAVVCLGVQEWKAATILAGSTIEGILSAALDVCHERGEVRQNAAATHRGQVSSGSRQWALEEMIGRAERQGIIHRSLASLLHAVRDWRNLVHPDREIRFGTSPGKNMAETAVRSIFQLLEALRIP